MHFVLLHLSGVSDREMPLYYVLLIFIIRYLNPGLLCKSSSPTTIFQYLDIVGISGGHTSIYTYKCVNDSQHSAISEYTIGDLCGCFVAFVAEVHCSDHRRSCPYARAHVMELVAVPLPFVLVVNPNTRWPGANKASERASGVLRPRCEAWVLVEG